MRAAVRAFGLVPIEQDRYEADDLIATYARQARERGADVLIISADKDLMQLIGEGVAMYDPASGEAGAKGAREERKIGEAEVLAYFGVPPEKVIDVQALAGDSTDNVPGARGIGVKTAAQLINEYGDLDTLLARAGEIKQPKRREILDRRRKASRSSKSRNSSSRSFAMSRSKCRSTISAWTRRTRDARRLLEGDGIHDDHAAAPPRLMASRQSRSSRT